LGISCISIFSNEPEAYNSAKTNYSEVKFSVLSIFKDNFEIGFLFEIFSRAFSQKSEPKKCVCFFVNMNQEHILSNEPKMQVQSKMADQNQIF
jgi:hypothetical protein